MKMLVLCFCLLLGLRVSADDRIRVVVPSEVEQQVQDLLERLVLAVEQEDHRAYASCFSKKAKAKYCEPAALDFVTHDMGMELGRWIITEESVDAATFIVKYAMSRDGERVDYVSKVRALRDGSAFVVEREEIQSSRPVGSGSKALVVALAACPDGKCPLPQKPQRQERVIPSLFNDANGNPDPNGIMWLDPTRVLGEECAPCNRRAK